MPKKLSRNQVDGVFYYRPCIDTPADHAAWAGYIQRFLRFLIHRYGKEEVCSWLFEVWNEPDLPVVFFSEDREAYFKLYETTAQAIKAVDPQLQVGVPATSGSKWVSSFLAYCREHEVPVDFVTTHQYAGDPIGGVESTGDDLEAESGDISTIRWRSIISTARSPASFVRAKTGAWAIPRSSACCSSAAGAATSTRKQRRSSQTTCAISRTPGEKRSVSTTSWTCA